MTTLQIALAILAVCVAHLVLLGWLLVRDDR